MDERWLSVDEVAEYLGIKRFTVYKWVQRLGLPVKKIGRLLRFRKSEIDKWIENQDFKTKIKDKSAESILKLLQNNAEAIRSFGVRRIGLFGSWARDEGSSESDIDVLVELDHVTFDRYMELKFFLEELLDRNVDLVLAETLKTQIRPKIMREVLYVQGI